MAKKQRLAKVRQRGAQMVKWISVHTGRSFRIAPGVAGRHCSVKVSASLCFSESLACLGTLLSDRFPCKLTKHAQRQDTAQSWAPLPPQVVASRRCFIYTLPTFVPDCLPHAGYNADQLAAGLQLATGLFLMLALMGWPRAWNALTLEDAAITPVYAVVTFIVVLQANLGECACAYWPCHRARTGFELEPAACARLTAHGPHLNALSNAKVGAPCCHGSTHEYIQRLTGEHTHTTRQPCLNHLPSPPQAPHRSSC